MVIPGNHDARNVGYVHFEELIGPRWQTLHLEQITIVAEDSTEPDLDHGQIGRARYTFCASSSRARRRFRLFMLHHHLLPGARARGGSATSSTTPATCSRCCRRAA